jgi:rod shape-determining protein MreC
MLAERAGGNRARLAAALGVAALVLTIWQHLAWSQGQRAWPEKLILRLLMPGVVAVGRVWTGISDVAFSLAAAGRLRAENRRLQEECARLQADKVRLLEYFVENKQLRALLKAPPPQTVKLVGAAQIIGRAPGVWRRRVKIQAAPGVQLAKDDFLLAEGCLAGRVLEAMGPVGEAVLIVDSEHAVAVLDQRSRDQGMLYAEPAAGGPQLLRMEKLADRCDLRPGDLILTSGLGQLYPKGIPVGQIVEVVSDPANGQVMRALVRPYVDFDHLEFVTVARALPGP